jgi:hypothetical protein
MAKGQRHQVPGTRHRASDFPNPIFDTALSPWHLAFAVIINPMPTSAEKAFLKIQPLCKDHMFKHAERTIILDI